MSDNISPPATARRSKLTKRRRYDDCSSTTTKVATTTIRTCSLQSLTNSSLVLSEQKQRTAANNDNGNNSNTTNTRQRKENVQNDSSSQPNDSSSSLKLSSSSRSRQTCAAQGKCSNDISGDRRTNDKSYGNEELDYSTNATETLPSSSSAALFVEQSCVSNMVNNYDNNQSSSLIRFMDNMHHHSPYIMSGINWMDYYSSRGIKTRLELDMEKAFTTTTFSNNHNISDKDNDVNLVLYPKNESTNNRVVRQYYGIVHPLVGRIDPHDVAVNDSNHNISLSSFAFPAAAQWSSNNSGSSSTKRSYTETTTTAHPITTLHRNYDCTAHTLLRRRHSKMTGLGMSIPYSWYRFPPSQSRSSLHVSDTESLVKHNDNNGVCNDVSKGITDNTMKSTIVDNSSGVESIVSHLTTQVVQENDNCNDNDAVIDNQLSSLASTIKQQQQQQPIGKIRIEPGQQATIRELYDIDKSTIIIGTLQAGIERYYYEKKTLPPPPISLLDDEEEEDEECVAVVRYKVALLPVDIILDSNTATATTTTSFIDKNNDNNNSPLVGWISDRGRFADDPYLILREIFE